MNEDAGIIFLGNVFPTKTRKNPNQGRVYSSSGIAPCLNTAGADCPKTKLGSHPQT